MSSRSLRDLDRIDYKIFSTEGVRVVKGPRNTGKMSGTQDSEKKISNKIRRFFGENVLADLFDIEEIEGSVGQLRELSDSYEDLHIKLNREFGTAYKTMYPDYDKTMQDIDSWLKLSRVEVRARKKLASESGRDKLRIEEEFFRSRIAREIACLDAENSNFVEDLERHTFVAQDLLKAYSGVFLRVKEQGVAFTKELQGVYDLQVEGLEDFIKGKREKVRKIKLEEIARESSRKQLDERKRAEEKDARDQQSIMICSNIYDNISERMAKLESKCKIDVTSLTDLQMMNAKKDFTSIDSEHTGILDKILKLTEANPSRYPETQNFGKDIFSRKSDLSKLIIRYKDSVEKQISKRDLSEDKIKNASVLGIKLPKFKGYDSEMDFYTFKSEFEKLVAPRISIQLQADYLKHNYLDGQALKLVKEIDDMSDIWARLKSSFGNVSTLLSTKLDKIDASTPLWKLKGDGKVVEAIINVKNLMTELATMSAKHSVEHSLYHTSNIAKVYNVLGRNRQLEFTKSIVTECESDIPEKELWEKLIDFLDKELRVKERILLFQKHDTKPDDSSSKKQDGASRL